MTVFGGKMVQEDTAKSERVSCGPVGTAENDLVCKMRTHFLRILSGFLPRYGTTRLHENKWKFTTLSSEFRERCAYLTFHARAEYYVSRDNAEQLIYRLRETEDLDNMGKRNTLLYIVQSQCCEPGRKWHRFGMWRGEEEMLALCREIPDDGEGVVAILRPEDRRAILTAWDKFKAAIDG